ncbi:SixA phosphatase family protein [Pararhizobium arenae]|uniref:SixA phosphatase family protein n=1 Tax=Pararhizobium arenae TaxID=1856850 RepID=UPI00094AA64D|nr:histidine phosphatase family protein [Pararhizobium arenae]
MSSAFRLYLLRHARASWAQPGQTDFERTLDDVGYADAEIMANTATDQGFRPDLVLCSTAARCRQTIEPFQRAAGQDLEIRFLDTLYTGDMETYRALIAANGDVGSLMLVGHNPSIQDVFYSLTSRTTSENAAPHGFLPGMLAVIDFTAFSQVTTGPPGILTALLSAPA